MNVIERLQTLIILIAVGLGMVVGQIPLIQAYAESAIVPFLLLMLYGLFLAIPLHELKNSFRNVKFSSTTLAINFIWTPILAWLLGALFLADHPALWIGLIMLMVTPCTDWYLVFTGIAKGNVALSTSILPVNLILQLLLLPVYLLLFTGITGTVHMSALIESILFVLLVPFALASLTRFLFRRWNQEQRLKTKLLPFFGNAQIIFLSLAIAAMFASQGTYLLQNVEVLLLLLLPILVFFVINFILGQVVGRFLRFRFAEAVSLNMTILARNSPISLAIAITAFPDQPLIALALVIGPLIELPLLAGVSQMLLFFKKKAPDFYS